MCHRALNASAIRPVERSLGFTIENIPPMQLEHGAHGGMKSSFAPKESAKARPQG